MRILLSLFILAGLSFAQTQPNVAAMKGPNVSAASALVILPGGGVAFVTLDMATLSIANGVLSAKQAPVVTVATRVVEVTKVTAAMPTYTLGSTPNAVPELDVFLNGVCLSAGVDYTVAGNVVTFTNGVLPGAADVLRVAYRTQ